MATGRTLDRWKRVYVDGYDFSGQARKVGPLEITRDAADLTAIADPVRGYLPNFSHVNVGAINSVFDNTATTGIHNRLVSAGVMRTVSVAQGIRAAPAQGDPVFAGQFTQGEYTVAEDGGERRFCAVAGDGGIYGDVSGRDTAGWIVESGKASLR